MCFLCINVFYVIFSNSSVSKNLARGLSDNWSQVQYTQLCVWYYPIIMNPCLCGICYVVQVRMSSSVAHECS